MLVLRGAHSGSAACPETGSNAMTSDGTIPTNRQIYRVAVASIVGSVIEQYDFLVTGVIAATIWGGALQDCHLAPVTGTQNFGKGLVQSIIALDADGALRLTTAPYFTPSVRSIQGDGIGADVIVEAPKGDGSMSQGASAMTRSSTAN